MIIIPMLIRFDTWRSPHHGILELLFWLKKLAYKGYVCYDTVALTHDPQRVIAECVRYTQA